MACRPALPPGKRSRPSSSFEPSSEAPSQAANFAASAACFDFSGTRNADPPRNGTAGSPFVHCGSGADSHLPAVSGATV
ncbi:hypothetical protein [Nonomuraea salmonea]|uniref:hypothetical protein n=1 Tax=Nonomuraea salmonea TaxID=46181 RepID=UPI002FEA5293